MLLIDTTEYLTIHKVLSNTYSIPVVKKIQTKMSVKNLLPKQNEFFRAKYRL